MATESKALPLATKPKTERRIELVPPDGGWGWMVLAGVALSNAVNELADHLMLNNHHVHGDLHTGCITDALPTFLREDQEGRFGPLALSQTRRNTKAEYLLLFQIFNQSMLSLFGLLYGDALDAMGQNTQGAAVVLSTMLFVANFGGPLAGVLLKLTSARCAAVTGACLCTSGIFLSGFATNVWHLVLSYGFLLGMGLGFIQNSSFVAINTYFKLRKSRAVGLANVGTGVGQTLMPHLVRYLLENYGYKGACLILSGLSLNGIAGTMLIQPVEWHLKKVEEQVIVSESMHLLNQKHKDIVIRKDSKSNFEVTYHNERRATEPTIHQENNDSHVFSSQRNINGNKPDMPNNNNEIKSNSINEEIKVSTKKSLWKKLYDLFDISLLSCPRFLNIIIGTALFVASIQNFSMIYPFFLQKVANMDKHQTAMCMSAVAFTDILGRLTLPIFQDKYQIKARWMLIMTNIWVLTVRQILAYQTNLSALLVLSCFYGVGRSMIIVARNFAISEYVKLEQVAAAVGLGMFTMGVIVPPSYYFIGWIRDYTGSYIASITAQNALTLVALLAWLPDMYLLWRHEKKQKKGKENINLS